MVRRSAPGPHRGLPVGDGGDRYTRGGGDHSAWGATRRAEQAVPQPSPGHEVVLSHLLERVDGYAASKAEYALVIADEVPDQAGHRADLGRYRVSGTGGYRSRRLTRIVDTLHFAPSHVSRLVQAADLVTYLFQRLELPGTDPRTARVNEQLWSLVEPRRYHSWCWDPMRRQS
ncbi:DUF3800 domain-containing protein [Micromonospora wenchangensis]